MYRVLLDGICVGVWLTETTSHYSGLGNVFLVQNSCQCFFLCVFSN